MEKKKNLKKPHKNVNINVSRYKIILDGLGCR